MREAGKGDKTRPMVNRIEFEHNYEALFGRKYVSKVCKFCKVEVRTPCSTSDQAEYCVNKLKQK